MSLARVQAVMAAGLEQPRLLVRWRAQPERLRALGVAPGEIDLDALAKFSGLGVKVRHNPLRAHYPLSFRLMSATAMEIAMFSAYAEFRSLRRLPWAAALPDRARDLLDFLDGWLDDADPVHARLRDALRYEDAIARLGPWHVAADDADVDAVDLPDVPRLRGTLRLREFGCDPRALAAALHASVPDLGAVPDEPHALCFWRAPEAEDVTVLDLDALGFHLLARIDGRRSVPALVRSLGGGRGATAVVRAALATLADF
ncbi:MAG: RiPP maturation protein ApyI, partial [Lysobacteraceae bacterium]